jgi:hypothetical protein
MRPEYIEAVNAVRTGWSFWIIWILPACVIWFSMLVRPLRPHCYGIVIICGAFVLAIFLFWYFAVSHAERIQSAKEANMQTEAERQDWASDTWRVFAPLFAIPYSLVYCTINLITAGLIRLLIMRFHQTIKSQGLNRDGT